MVIPQKSLNTRLLWPNLWMTGRMGYWQRRQQRRLYKQWEKHSELPPQVATQDVMPRGVMAEEIGPLPAVHDDSKIGIDVKAGLREDSRFYRFRVKIRDAVGKLLRVD